ARPGTQAGDPAYRPGPPGDPPPGPGHDEAENRNRLRRHLRPDAVAGKDGDGGGATHGPTSTFTCARCARRVSSLLSAFRYARALAWMMSVWLPCPVTVTLCSVTRHDTSPCASVPPVMALTA